MSEIEATDMEPSARSRREARQQSLRFDDRVDLDTDISSAQAIMLFGRCLRLLGEAPGLFAAKFALAFGLVWPGLLLPWIAKIVTDNVLLDRPFGETDIPYPPFMNPIIDIVNGMAPMDIMLVFAGLYAILLLIFGMRAGGTYVELFEGADAATQAENQISGGDSEGSGLWGVAECLVNVRLSQRLANSIRTRLFERLTRLPMTTLDDQRIGDSIYRVLYDAPAIPGVCYHLAMEPVFIALAAVINVYLLQYSYGGVMPELVWIGWSAFPLALILTLPASALVRRTNQTKRAAGSATTNAMEETFDNITAVQSLGGLKREAARFASRSAESFFRERVALAVSIALISLGLIVIVVLGLYVTIVVSDKIIDGEMTPGDFFTLFGIFLEIVFTAGAVGAYWIQLQGPAAAIRRVFFFIDYHSPDDQAGGAPVPPITRDVTFDAVDFVYPDGRQALAGISLELKVGELVAIVGPTGAGKTSLAYLIPAFLQATSGRVLVDGLNVAEVDLDTLRGQMAYVFQEHLLLAETIRENLLLAKPDASGAEIDKALADAVCLDFIAELPEGIDTVLGQSGDTLSVGQQQRLSIARGLLRDARVLILDEPTAALDPKTEAKLVETLRATARGCLVVVIAHRLSTIRHADRIVFLDDGRIRDVGDHESLMAKPGGAYRTFVELQQPGATLTPATD